MIIINGSSRLNSQKQFRGSCSNLLKTVSQSKPSHRISLWVPAYLYYIPFINPCLPSAYLTHTPLSPQNFRQSRLSTFHLHSFVLTMEIKLNVLEGFFCLLTLLRQGLEAQRRFRGNLDNFCVQIIGANNCQVSHVTDHLLSLKCAIKRTFASSALHLCFCHWIYLFLNKSRAAQRSFTMSKCTTTLKKYRYYSI